MGKGAVGVGVLSSMARVRNVEASADFDFEAFGHFGRKMNLGPYLSTSPQPERWRVLQRSSCFLK